MSHEVVKSQDIVESNKAISKIIKTLNVGIDCFNLDIKSAQRFFDENSHLGFSTKLANQVKNYDVVLNLYTQCRIFWKLNQVANFLSRMSSFWEAILIRLAKNLKYYDKNDFRKLITRHSKLNFINKEILKENNPDLINNWEDVKRLLNSLNFWCEQRNAIIHSAEGVSKVKMEELYEEKKRSNPHTTSPDSILTTMEQMLNNGLEIIPKEYLHKYVGDNQAHYIYSEVKDWVIQTLDSQI